MRAQRTDSACPAAVPGLVLDTDSFPPRYFAGERLRRGFPGRGSRVYLPQSVTRSNWRSTTEPHHIPLGKNRAADAADTTTPPACLEGSGGDYSTEV